MRRTAAYYALLIAAWIGAWIASGALGVGRLSPAGQFLYWTCAKLLIWVVPMLVVITFFLKRSAFEYLALGKFSRGLRFGLAIGLALVCVAFSVDVMTKHFAWPTLGPPLLNAVVVAPLLEEVVFRGFILRTLLESGERFWPANVTTALMFLGLHLPGWYFSGLLTHDRGLLSLTIVLVGLVAGLARRASGSTWASVFVHFSNNAYSTLIH